MADRIVTCSEHPDQELTPRYGRELPVTVYGRAMQCPDPRHGHGGRHRCARCGRQVFLARSYQAVYCGGTCRVAAHRANKRAELARELAGSAGADTGTDTAGMSPAGEAHTGRSS